MTTRMTGNPDFVNGMKYLFDREQIRTAVFRGYAVIGNDQPIPPDHRYYFAASAAAARSIWTRRSSTSRRRAHRRARCCRSTRRPARTARWKWRMLMQQTRRESRPEPHGQPRAGRRLLVEPLDEASARTSATSIRARAPTCCSRSSSSRTPPWNESGWKNPKFDQLLLAARSANRRREAQADVRRHAGPRRTKQGGIGIPVFISLARCAYDQASARARLDPDRRHDGLHRSPNMSGWNADDRAVGSTRKPRTRRHARFARCTGGDLDDEPEHSNALIGRARCGLALLTLLIVSIIVFLITGLLPGDAAQEALGQAATPETVAALRQQFGLDQPRLPALSPLAHRSGASATSALSLSNNMPVSGTDRKAACRIADARGDHGRRVGADRAVDAAFCRPCRRGR